MVNPDILMALILLAAVVFNFLNGFHGSANVVATLISSRAMTPRAALLIASSANFIGPFLFGMAVARTIGSEVVRQEALTPGVLLAALLSASAWSFLTWFLGLPSSSSHALMGGLVGAVVIRAGWQALQVSGLLKIGITLLVSPLVGFVVGALFMRLVLWISRGATPKANIFFRMAQLPTALVLSLSHGSNDAQKTMGLISLALLVLGKQAVFSVPPWVVIVCAVTIALGTASGGWRLIRTLGAKFYRVRPVHSFTAQLSAAAVILAASLLGGPVSTTHVVSTSILGVGSAQRVSQVRWRVLGEIALAWLLTIPMSAGLAMLMYLLFARGIP